MSQNQFDMSQFPKTGQRLAISTRTDDIHNQENPAILADANDIAKDTAGFTNPNLHRRIRINTWHDGKKVYTIAESYTAGESNTQYQINYPIANIKNIKFIYISGIPIQSISDSIELVRNAETQAVVGFKFTSGHIPQIESPIEVIYETIPLIDDEATYRDYEVAISGVYSYRTTKVTLHTEEDEGNRDQRVYENEIP